MKKTLYFFLLLFTTIFISCKDTEDESIASVQGDQDQDYTTDSINDNYRYQIPVIFHVLYANANDTNQYVPYKRIKEILQNVNKLWKGGYYDYKSLGLSQDMGVDFVLASTDENGKALAQPGVEYIKYTGSYPIDAETFMTTSGNRKYMWEPNEFLNVMLYNFKHDDESGNTLLGISHLPYTIKDNNELEGLTTTSKYPLSKNNLNFCYCSSINSLYQSRKYEDNRYSYYQTNSVSFCGNDINNTLAHELGHYLGLFHVFAEKRTDDESAAIDSCADTDFCEDTPSYNFIEYQEYLSSLSIYKTYTMNQIAWRSNCKTSTHYDATNIMDYWVCYANVFTQQQRERVRHVLYYSPLIPGPKKNGACGSSTRSVDDNYLLPKARIEK
jgi:zinc-dependent metalloproteinase lipoprotein